MATSIPDRSRRARGAWLAVVAAAIAGGAVVMTSSGDGGEPRVATASLWIDVDGGTCTRSSRPAAYSDAAACDTIDAAWDAATAGDTIRMRAGSYGDQTVTGDKSSTTTVIGGEGGATTIGVLDTQGDNLELTNVTGTVWDTGTGNSEETVGADVTLRDVNLDRVWLSGGVNQRWIGGNLGPTDSTNTVPIWIVGDGSPVFPVSGTVIEGVEIHHNTNTGNPSWHLEMIRIEGAVRDTTIRNNFFHDNTSNTSTIFITDNPGTGPPTGLTVVGNRFAPDVDNAGAGHAALHTQNPVITSCTDYLIAYNTLDNAPLSLGCASMTNVTIVGNLGSHADLGCFAGASYVKNARQNASSVSCGSDTWITDFGRLGQADGFRLRGGSPALGAAETANCPRTDFEGTPRPSGGGSCDAGADEQ